MWIEVVQMSWLSVLKTHRRGDDGRLGCRAGLRKPTALFADEYDFGQGISIANYDLTPDGQFIMLRRDANGGKLRVIVDWTDELKQILASGGER